MSYYDIQESANLHRPIKYNQGWRQGKSIEGRTHLGVQEAAPLGDAFYEKLHRS